MKRTITTLLAVASLAVSSFGADFFSTKPCENLFDLGVRLGVNTTNRTIDPAVIPGYEHQSWGTGFDLGVVADLNIRNYLAIQPGLFFESRSGNYSFVTSEENGLGKDYLTQIGHRRSYNLSVPVLASFRFNITDNIRWIAEFGPYFSFVLSSSMKDKALVATAMTDEESDLYFAQKPASFDFGFKIGTGLQILGHYYVGVHYEAGALKAYKDRKLGNIKESFGGRTKGWIFSLGYTF